MKDELISSRRSELVAKIKKHREAGDHIKYDESPLRVRYEAAFDRLIAIDGLEAQAQLARSQESLADSQREVAEAQAAETKRLEDARTLSDNHSFWFRRFLTSLTVAHGAGAFAALTSMMRTPPPVATQAQSGLILGCFLIGLLFMGSLPMIYAVVDPKNPNETRIKNNTPIAWAFASISTALLLIGVLAVIKVAHATYEHNAAKTDPLIATNLNDARPASSPAN